MGNDQSGDARPPPSSDGGPIGQKEEEEEERDIFAACFGSRKPLSMQSRDAMRTYVSASSPGYGIIQDEKDRLLKEKEDEIIKLRALLASKSIGTSQQTLEVIQKAKESEDELRRKDLEIESLRKDLEHSQIRANTALRTARNAMQKQNFLPSMRFDENDLGSSDCEGDAGDESLFSTPKEKRIRKSIDRDSQELVAALEHQYVNKELSLDDYALALAALTEKEETPSEMRARRRSLLSLASPEPKN